MPQNQNEIFWFIALVVILFLCLLIFFLAIMVKNYKVRQKAEGDVKDAIINTQENEQNRIAEDLHDDIGPMLSAIKLRISALSDTDKDEMKESLVSIENYLNQVINNVRAVSRNLSSQLILKFGLEQSLRDNISMIASMKNINVKLDFDLNRNKLAPKQEINIYRILRELMNNSVKHSNCQNIKIALSKENDNYLLKYSDDGRLPGEIVNSKSMGQTNIRNRVNLLKGTVLKFTEDFSHGAEYVFLFPVNTAK